MTSSLSPLRPLLFTSARTRLGNALWTLSNSRPHARYLSALKDPRGTQESLLLSFLHRNADTAYGRAHRYAKIETVSQFQDAVPIVTYDDLLPWVARLLRGEQGVLTAEPVLMFEKTSGSAGGAKYIPYTASLRREFQQAVGAWMYDLFTKRPALKGGAQYWSISPSARVKEVTPGGLPVGFEDDTEYLGVIERLILRWVMAVPGSVARIPDMVENRRVTLANLIARPDLRFISVWNPSFLSILMSRLPLRPAAFWPDLQLISCWTSASAARFVPELRSLFPGVEIQGKGLLSTEGVVSFPEIGRPAASPAITSHFLEFVDRDGRARLVDELEVGERYRVLMTTGGGFARYDLGDLVEVVAPNAIDFVGRDSCVSDLCGEKLSEAFVSRVLTEATDGFALLAPEWGRPPRYTLFVESGDATRLAAYVEERLRDAVHYDYGRRLEQLAPVEGVTIRDANERYLAACEAMGQRAGNVKPPSLRRETGWLARLAPELCHAGR